jgi:conjugal transfer pilus assembly protein TraV
MRAQAIRKPSGRVTTLAVICLSAAVLSGCATQMSAVGGDSRYGCSAPTGAQCTSVSGVYANALRGSTTPSAQAWLEQPATNSPTTQERPQAAQQNTAEPQSDAPESKPEPLRLPPRVLRLWVAPWEDGDGDLHEAATVHVLVDIGRWRIEHVRPSTPRDLGAAKPPARAEAPSTPTTPPSPAPQR